MDSTGSTSVLLTYFAYSAADKSTSGSSLCVGLVVNLAVSWARLLCSEVSGYAFDFPLSCKTASSCSPYLSLSLRSVLPFSLLLWLFFFHLLFTSCLLYCLTKVLPLSLLFPPSCRLGEGQSGVWQSDPAGAPQYRQVSQVLGRREGEPGPSKFKS